MTACLGAAFAASGSETAARRIIAELDDLARRRYVDQALVATIFATLGDNDHAMTRLERAFEDHSCELRRMLVDPRLDGLHSDQRFEDLARRAGF